ncbi:MAG: type II toxin-antitoxin system RelE/ParE family toxin [Eubacterium sp.]
MAAKLVGLMEVLEGKGTALRKPYSEYLDDGIFELRCKQGSNITRVLYFFYIGKKKKDHCYKWICEENTEELDVRNSDTKVFGFSCPAS